MYCTVLYCTVLYCTVLYCTVLYKRDDEVCVTLRSFQVCVTPDNQTVVENVWPGDCRELSLAYVLDKARMMGAAAFAMSAFTVKL